MSTTFPRTRKSALGYNIEQVEDFLEDARRAFDEGLAQADRALLRAEDIRRTAFVMQKGGYSPRHVDAALERLEDVFALRERESASALLGEDVRLAHARKEAQVILDRLVRPDHHRFLRTGPLTYGYNVEQVDDFARRLIAYFQEGTPLSVDQVRTAVFRAQRRGYNEAQVDLVLDGVIAIMLAVR